MHDTPDGTRLHWRALSNGNAAIAALAAWGQQAKAYAKACGLTELDRHEYDVLMGFYAKGYAPFVAVDLLVKWREVRPVSPVETRERDAS